MQPHSAIQSVGNTQVRYNEAGNPFIHSSIITQPEQKLRANKSEQLCRETVLERAVSYNYTVSSSPARPPQLTKRQQL